MYLSRPGRVNDDSDGKVTCWWYVCFIFCVLYFFVFFFCAVIKGWFVVVDFGVCFLLVRGWWDRAYCQ